MTTEPPAILLDISRTISRAGFGQYSGIDRVEQAYIEYLLARPGEVYFISRGLGGFAILDRSGMAAFLKNVREGKPLDRPDLLSRLSRRQSPELKQAESTMRRLAKAVAPRSRLASLVKRVLPDGFLYLNVSHSNRSSKTIQALRKGGARSVCLMVHDIIPLEFPEYSRQGTSQQFAERLASAAREADFLIFNSTDTAQKTQAWLRDRGIERPGVVAQLGTPPLVPSGVAAVSKPYFVCIGTIEPRKNHLLLLEVWNRIWETHDGGIRPKLLIVGRRGWENDAVFQLLDSAPYMGELVFEENLSDQEVADHLAGACALLFPSFAEGFGLPLTEAMSLGCPVFCADLQSLREVGGDFPTYLDPNDIDAWFDAVSTASRTEILLRKPQTVPSWDKHFETVMQGISDALAPTAQGPT